MKLNQSLINQIKEVAPHDMSGWKFNISGDAAKCELQHLYIVRSADQETIYIGQGTFHNKSAFIGELNKTFLMDGDVLTLRELKAFAVRTLQDYKREFGFMFTHNLVKALKVKVAEHSTHYPDQELNDLARAVINSESLA